MQPSRGRENVSVQGGEGGGRKNQVGKKKEGGGMLTFSTVGERKGKGVLVSTKDHH